jgi:dTDP-4-dehydrorhamnose reductase
VSFNVLVTGANGQLGRTIRNRIEMTGSIIKFDFLTKEALDITSKEGLSNFFSDKDYKFCINCAAFTNVEDSEKQPEKAFSVNAEGVKNLAEACHDKSIVLIHISTDYVFDGEKGEPYFNTDVPNPINAYGRSKLSGEHYIQEITDNYFIIRASWLYSKTQGSNFYRAILEKAKRGEELWVTDSQKGCPTDCVDLADLLINILTMDDISFGIYHFATNKGMTWYDFAVQILTENNLFSSTSLIKSNKYSTFTPRPNYSVLKSNF